MSALPTNITDCCFCNSYGFSLILVSSYSRYDLRYSVIKSPPLPESIQSRAKPCFLEPFSKSPPSSLIKTAFSHCLTDVSPSSPRLAVCLVSRNNRPSGSNSRFVPGSLWLEGMDPGMGTLLHIDWTNQAISKMCDLNSGCNPNAWEHMNYVVLRILVPEWIMVEKNISLATSDSHGLLK